MNEAINNHPRLIVNDFSLIVRKVTDATYGDQHTRDWYKRLKSKADELLDEKPVEYIKVTDSNVTRMLDVSREVMNRIYTLSVVYKVENKLEYLTRLGSELENATSFKDWNPAHYLDTAEMLHAFAIAYDWLYHDLTAEQKTNMRHAMISKGLEPALSHYNLNLIGILWTDVTSNWNVVCNSGVIMAALAIADEVPVYSNTLLERALNSIKNGISPYAPDGGYREGPGYWSYATKYLVLAMASIESAFQDTNLPIAMKLFDYPGVKDAADFAVYSNSSAGTFNYGDSVNEQVNSPVLFWYANKLDMPLYSWWQRDFADKNPTALDLIWYDPDNYGLDQNPQLLKYFTNSQDVFMRSSWEEPNALFVGFKGGDNSAPHAYLSNGTFVLDALGERWIATQGMGDYSLPNYFDFISARWQYYNTRAEGQNTIVINPGLGPDQVVEAEGKMEEVYTVDGEHYAVLNMTDVYKDYVNSAKRKVRMFDNFSKVQIIDQLQLKSQSDVWWFMHTAADIQISLDKKSALLTINGKRMRVDIKGNSSADLLAMDGKPLPTSPRPLKNKKASLKKLAVNLQGDSLMDLTVEFTPLSPTGSLPKPTYVEPGGDKFKEI